MGSKKLIALGIIALMFFAGVAMLFFAAIPSYQNASALIKNEKSAQATITNVWDEESGGGRNSSWQRYCSYSFEVKGRRYNGKSQVSSNYNQSGDITIYYLVSNPLTCAIDPAGDLTNARNGILFVIVWIVAVFVIGVVIFFARVSS